MENNVENKYEINSHFICICCRKVHVPIKKNFLLNVNQTMFHIIISQMLSLVYEYHCPDISLFWTRSNGTGNVEYFDPIQQNTKASI